MKCTYNGSSTQSLPAKRNRRQAVWKARSKDEFSRNLPVSECAAYCNGIKHLTDYNKPRGRSLKMCEQFKERIHDECNTVYLNLLTNRICCAT